MNLATHTVLFVALIGLPATAIFCLCTMIWWRMPRVEVGFYTLYLLNVAAPLVWVVTSGPEMTWSRFAILMQAAVILFGLEAAAAGIAVVYIRRVRTNAPPPFEDKLLGTTIVVMLEAFQCGINFALTVGNVS